MNEDAHATSASEESGIRIPVRSKVTVSRIPAALFGMLAVLLAGVLYIRVLPDLRGEVLIPNLNGYALVHLTDNGVSPVTVHVYPGQTVTWQNDRTIPESITSDELKDGSGNVLHTAMIEPGETQSIVIAATQAIGMYAYGFPASEEANGFIAVDALPPSTIAPFRIQSSDVAIPASSSSSAVDRQESLQRIPRNPFTVINGPLSLGDASSFAALKKPTNASSHPSAYQLPPEQTKSGPELWVAIILSILAMTVLLRKTPKGFTA